MCGINGIISNATIPIAKVKETISGMNTLITHRGPDEDGFFVEQNNSHTVAMAMRRLSIIDLSTGQQPIYSNDKQLVIVFNGEIYNYRELKAELLQQGVTFTTNSDTEVILKLYENYKENAFSKLDGMYAFSILDKKRNKVFIARDFFGEKPLYFTQDSNTFMWASELKSIAYASSNKLKISKLGVNLFLRLTYIPAPYCIYENVHKLEANSYLEYSLDSNTYQIKKIAHEAPPNPSNISFNDAKKKVKELVTQSVLSRSVSDVPLGTFLSGGVDSSIVSLCLSRSLDKKIDTFSIGFKKASFDETDKSRIVAKLINSNHHEFIIGEDDLKDNIHEILLNFDEPFSDTAALPTHLMSKKTREYVTVALTGDGGDEVFGGYNKYYIGKMNQKYTRIVPKFIHSLLQKTANNFLTTKDDRRGKRFKIRKLLNAINYEGGFYWDIISLANTNKQIKELLQPDVFIDGVFEHYKKTLGFNNPTSLTHFRLVDKLVSLEGGMLPKVDRTSMMNSLECRAPFLNREIWEFSNTLPENYLMKGWNKKYILKEAFREDFPDNFLDRSKSGFGSPVGDWLRSSLKQELLSYIDKQKLTTQNLFNIEAIQELVTNHVSGKADNTFRVWAFYCFQKWYFHNYTT